MSTQEQRTAREAAEVLRSLEEDLQRAMREHRDIPEQHEQRLRAIEAALIVLLNTLANDN